MNLHEAKILRDKHRLRTPEETIALYEFINTAATDREYAAVFTILQPFMLNVVKDVKKRYSLFDIEDMAQDAFIMLSDFVDRYNPKILSFMGFVLPYFSFSFNRYCYKKYRHLYMEFADHFGNYIDKRAGTEDYALGVIFAKNILKEFDKAPSCKGITNSKRFEVHNKIISHYFIDNLTINDIAAIMNSSYYSVYEKIARYLYYLSTVLNKDEFRTLELYNEVKHGTGSRIIYSKVYEFRGL